MKLQTGLDLKSEIGQAIQAYAVTLWSLVVVVFIIVMSSVFIEMGLDAWVGFNFKDSEVFFLMNYVLENIGKIGKIVLALAFLIFPWVWRNFRKEKIAKIKKDKVVAEEQAKYRAVQDENRKQEQIRLARERRQREIEKEKIRVWFQEQKQAFRSGDMYRPRIFPSAAIPAFVRQLTWEQFEVLVKELLQAEGWSVNLTTQGADKGIDLIARRSGQTKYVQVKHYHPDNKIGVTVIRQIIGASSRESNAKAMVVTASSFTKPALEESKAYGDSLTLWNLNDVCQKIQTLTDSQFVELITDPKGNIVLKDALEAAMNVEESFIRRN